VPKHLDTEFIKIVSLLLRTLLLVAFAAVILHMFIGIYYSIVGAINSPSSIETYIYSFIDIIVEDSLLAVVIFEIYESIIEFFHGEGDTILYIINGAISFTAREIIVTVFAAHIFKVVDAYEIIGFAVLILALTAARYLLIISGARGKEQ
jgi:uncharacterized membrane protein (DUF373 family)